MLGEMADSTEQEKYKVSLEHLVVPRCKEVGERKKRDEGHAKRTWELPERAPNDQNSNNLSYRVNTHSTEL